MFIYRIQYSATICAYDSYCCDNSWDSICAGSAVTECANSEDEGHYEETAVVELLDVHIATDIKRNSWHLVEDIWFDHIAYHRAVVYNNEVMIVGGGQLDYSGNWYDNDYLTCLSISGYDEAYTMSHVCAYAVYIAFPFAFPSFAYVITMK